MCSQSPPRSAIVVDCNFLSGVQTRKCTVENFQKEIGLRCFLCDSLVSIHRPRGCFRISGSINQSLTHLETSSGAASLSRPARTFGKRLAALRYSASAGKKSSPREEGNTTQRFFEARRSRLDSCLHIAYLGEKKTKGREDKTRRGRNGHMMLPAGGKDASVQRLHSAQGTCRSSRKKKMHPFRLGGLNESTKTFGSI